MSVVVIDFITLNRYVVVHRDFDQIRWNLALFDNKLFLNETNNSIIFFSVLKHVQQHNVPPDYGQSMFVSSAMRFLPASVFADNQKPFPPNLKAIYNSFTFEEDRDGNPAVTNIGEYYLSFREGGVAFFMFLLGGLVAKIKVNIRQPASVAFYCIVAALLFQIITRGFLPQVIELTFYMLLPFALLWTIKACLGFRF